jgi:excinuclease ABC subunit A
LTILRRVAGAEAEDWETLRYSTDYRNPDTGFTLPQLTPKHFSFNSHLGACPACHGLGTELICDADLMIPDRDKSLAEGAIAPWTKAAKRMQSYYQGVLGSLAREYKVSLETPYRDLPEAFHEVLAHGTGDRVISFAWGESGKRDKIEKPFEGLVASLQRLYDTTDSEFTRQRIRQYMSRRTCSVCQGARLKPEILAVTIGNDFSNGVNLGGAPGAIASGAESKDPANPEKTPPENLRDPSTALRPPFRLRFAQDDAVLDVISSRRLTLSALAVRPAPRGLSREARSFSR